MIGIGFACHELSMTHANPMYSGMAVRTLVIFPLFFAGDASGDGVGEEDPDWHTGASLAPSWVLTPAPNNLLARIHQILSPPKKGLPPTYSLTESHIPQECWKVRAPISTSAARVISKINSASWNINGLLQAKSLATSRSAHVVHFHPKNILSKRRREFPPAHPPQDSRSGRRISSIRPRRMSFSFGEVWTAFTIAQRVYSLGFSRAASASMPLTYRQFVESTICLF